MSGDDYQLEMQDTPEPKESVELAKGFNYFRSLRAKGVYLWKNDEFPPPEVKRRGGAGWKRANGKPVRYGTPNRELGLDVQGLCEHQGGRHLEIEWKRRSEYEYLMRHYDELRDYYGDIEKDNRARLGNQIRHCEMVNKHGGFAMFAWFWKQVQEAFLREGIDPG